MKVTIVPCQLLTILPVVGDLHFALLRPKHSLSHLLDGILVCQVSMKEVTGAGPLHDIWPGEACHLTEAIVAVDYSTIFHPGIGYYKFSVCRRRRNMRRFLK